jgi:microcystin-dependent protein
MRIGVLAAAALAVMAIAGATAPALAESSGYTVSPAGPTDPRNNFVPQSSAVFVVDNAKGSISVLPRQ